ncbi:MAG TPA: Crp/Fnr family transcriptional regulator [Bacteroidetes bacterium]|nr:Crp/Fnr family transcriptional regulator [Bacteroidota bacterium]
MTALISYLNSIHRISSESERVLRDISQEISIPKNSDLHPIGHTCRNLYFVKKGLLRVYYLKGAIDVTESFEFENSIVARADSLFQGNPSRKGIQAIEDSDLIALPSDLLFKLYDSQPDIERLFRKVFELAYVETVCRMESIQFHSAKERYENLLKSSPKTIQRIPLKLIASYLGITQVSLSRIRHA